MHVTGCNEWWRLARGRRRARRDSAASAQWGQPGRTRRRRPAAAHVTGGSRAPGDSRRPARRPDLAAAKLTPCARARWARGQTREMSNPETQEHPQVLVVGPDGITTA